MEAMSSEKFSKLMKVALSTKEGRDILRDLFKKHFPKCTIEPLEKMLSGNLSESEFLNSINNNALDALNNGTETKDNVETVLVSSENARKDFIDKKI